MSFLHKVRQEFLVTAFHGYGKAIKISSMSWASIKKAIKQSHAQSEHKDLKIKEITPADSFAGKGAYGCECKLDYNLTFADTKTSGKATVHCLMKKEGNGKISITVQTRYNLA